MNIWIINSYGNIPGEGWREYRSTMIAEALTKNNHNVTWWTSNFEHRSKKFRSEGRKTITVSERFKIELIPATAYQGHISLKRIKSERTFIKNLEGVIRSCSEKPDIIISGEPAIFVSDVIMRIVKFTKAKLIIDIIDLWPELFNIMLPKSFSHLGKFLFSPLYIKRSWFLKKADALIAVSKDYLKLGLQINNTPRNEVVYWGVDLNDVKAVKAENTPAKPTGDFWIIYAGTFGDNYDLKTIMQCALVLEKDDCSVKIFLAGDGPLKQFVTDFIKENNLLKTTYLGRISSDELDQLYKKCDAGISSYVSGSTVSMPIKAYDYLAAGLPLINSLKKDLGQFVTEYNAGVQYEAENVDSMYQAIKKLYASPQLLRETKDNALNLSKYFDKDKQYKKLVFLCESLNA